MGQANNGAVPGQLGQGQVAAPAMALKLDDGGEMEPKDYPWFPVASGFIQPQFHAIGDDAWLTFSQEVMRWDLKKVLGESFMEFSGGWRVVPSEEFVAALEATRG